MDLDNQRGREDPLYFINDFLGIPLHDGQKRYLVEAKKAIENPGSYLIRRFILSCANRWGKSTMIACLQLWYLFYKFGIRTNSEEEWFEIEYRTANIAPYSSLTEPVFKAMKAIMSSTYPIPNIEGKLITNKCKISDWFLEDRTLNTPPYKLFFANNSYIEHLSLQGGKGDNLQGKPYGIITYDEASRSDHLQVEIDNSILGRLLDWTAPLHLLSTPDSDSSSLLYYKQLYDEGLVGLNSSYTQTGEIYENTFFTPGQIREQEEMLKGSPLRNQMLKGEFIFGSNNLFYGQDIIDALDESLDDGVRYESGHKYTIGIDTAIGSDEMVYSVLDCTEKPFRLVREMAVKGNSKSPQAHLNDFLMLFNEYQQNDESGYSNVNVILETFNGESVRFYHDLPPNIQSFTKCFGSWRPSQAHIQTDNPMRPTRNEVKKADVLVGLKKLFSAHDIKLPKSNFRLTQQLAIYKEDDKKIPTDRVIALALAAHLAEQLSIAQAPEWATIEW